MVRLLHSEEVLQMGINIERNGRAFYKKAAELAQTEDARKLFDFLKQQEEKHQEQFEQILLSGGSYHPPQEVAEEESYYLQAMADMFVFTPQRRRPEEAAEQAKSTEEVLRIGINVEKDSILLYRNMEDYVSPEEASIVHEIRRQEQMHLRLLHDKLQEFSGAKA